MWTCFSAVRAVAGCGSSRPSLIQGRSGTSCIRSAWRPRPPIGPRLAHTPADTGDRSGLICTPFRFPPFAGPLFPAAARPLRLPADLEFTLGPARRPRFLLDA